LTDPNVDARQAAIGKNYRHAPEGNSRGMVTHRAKVSRPKCFDAKANTENGLTDLAYS
jgi:hypothetical protein